MSRLTWGAVGARFYESGVDRGVLYRGSETGVPWNGLVSVSETPTGAEATPFYVDGVKYSNLAANEEFEATIEAYTYPDEFSECDGTASISNGLSGSQQRRKMFGLCYRTRVGNDVDGAAHGYKIHLVYNALAAPSSKSYKTLSDANDVDNFSWPITTRPPAIGGRKRTSHFVIDSRKTTAQLLSRIEDVLYGTDLEPARLPSVPELVYIFESETTSFFDAGTPIEPYYATFDGGMPPSTVQTSTVDGGAA